ncbi:MAG: hypothetical protein IPH53_05015 [Flavobacteriales bacterium]|nr:hypothetical protein [Flavobacteriales bacterium]
MDIHIKNPNCRVLGYEFELSGLTIQNVENLAPTLQNDISVTSSLGGMKVIGLSYLDTTLAKNTSWVPLVRVHYLALTGSQVCISHITDVANDQANNVITRIIGPCLTVPNTVVLDVKAFLEGPYVDGTGLMNDALRSAALILRGALHGIGLSSSWRRRRRTSGDRGVRRYWTECDRRLGDDPTPQRRDPF